MILVFDMSSSNTNADKKKKTKRNSATAPKVDKRISKENQVSIYFFNAGRLLIFWARFLCVCVSSSPLFSHYDFNKFRSRVSMLCSSTTHVKSSPTLSPIWLNLSIPSRTLPLPATCSIPSKVTSPQHLRGLGPSRTLCYANKMALCVLLPQLRRHGISLHII